MTEWKIYKLGELGTLARGKSKHRPRDAAFLYGGKYPFIQTGDIKAANHKISTHSQTLSEEGLKQSKLWGKGTICITIAANIADTAILDYPACFPDSVIGFVPNKEVCDVDFMEYQLQFAKRSLQSHSIGSVQDNINLGTFQNFTVTIPDLTTQTQIAQILTSLDDKIELNLQMNQTLEAMAQALFKEWFVNFNFPNFDGELENRLPKGWIKCQVKDICEANASTLNSKDAINEVHYIEISEVDRGIIKNISIYKRGEEPSRAKRKLKHGDTVLSTVRPNRGSYFLSIFPNENLIASTGFAVFSPTTVPFSYLYIFLTNDDQLEFYGKMADGAAYPAINQSVIMNMEIILPAKELLEKYHDVSGNLLIRIFDNLEANKILTQTRDTLLPKLMSGKIEILR